MATYRDLKVRAVVGDAHSNAFYVKQNSSAERVTRLVLRLDEAKPNQKGESQINTSNGEYKVFGNQKKEWLDTTLTGYRRKVGDTTVIVVEVQPSDIPTEAELEGIKAF